MPRRSWTLPNGVPYETHEFMDRHGLDEKAAQAILKTNGPSRERCDAAATAFLAARAARQDRSPPRGRRMPARSSDAAPEA